MFLVYFVSIVLFLSGLIALTFRNELSVKGNFLLCLTTLIICLLLTVLEFFCNMSLNIYHHLDLGTFVIIDGLIESKFLFTFDMLSYICSFLVILLTILAQLFGIEYMYREAFITRLSYLLNMFSSAVIIIFSIYDLLLLFIFWEIIALLSYLLVSYYTQKVHITKSSLKVIYFSRISDIFIFLTYFFCMRIFHSTDMSSIFVKVPEFSNHITVLYARESKITDLFYVWRINSLNLIGLFVASAALIKSSQIGYHVWLPAAMSAPTPASSLIHSSTLVIIGIYLIIRFSVIFEFTLFINLFFVIIGSTTIAYGSVSAFYQTDIKRTVAYSTISQMGYLFAGLGFHAFEEVIIYLIIHAINKSFLFIVVGYTVHFFNSNTDLRQMSRIYLYEIDISIFFFITFLNLTGLPYFLGFYAKEYLLYKIFLDDFFSIYFVRAFWIISFIYTPLYMFLLIFSVSFNFSNNLINFYKLNLKNHNLIIDYFIFNTWLFHISKYNIINIISCQWFSH